LTENGTFTIYCGVVDMGQGNASTCLQIAGDILNQDPGRMEAVLPDTDRTLPSGSSSASRTTYTFGNALIQAARALEERIREKASDLFLARHPDEVALLPGRVRHLPSGREMELAYLARMFNPNERVFTARFRAPVSEDIPVDDPALRLHGIPHLIFSYGAHLAAVELDTLTGELNVKEYVSVSDCGRIINPQMIEQQMQGGAAQGLGYVLMEELVVEKGRTLTPDLATYLIPTALDLPDQESLFAQIPEQTGPYGLKGAGEVATNGPFPCVANALADACGIRLTRGPLTPERVLMALDRVKEES
jgi:CO/xanthine dehydrogenase Mo-binding subunit